MTVELATLAAASAVLVVSLFYFLMAFGWRRGEFVWGGRHPRRLPPHLRRLSLGFGILLVVGGLGVALLSGELAGIGLAYVLADFVPAEWHRSAVLVLVVFFGAAGLFRLARGAFLERIAFGPIMLATAVLAGLIGFS